LFCRVDNKLTQANKNQKHTKANLYPSEVVTIALLFALKDVGNRVLVLRKSFFADSSF